MTPLISVVVPTYRRPHLLEQCLQALFSQTISGDSFEIIIVDDAPEEDQTRELIHEWQQRLESPISYFFPVALPVIPVTGAAPEITVQDLERLFRARVSTSPALVYIANYGPHGPAAARNLGWQNANGQIIAFTDDDCLPEPDWLSNGVAAFIDGVSAVSGRVIVPISATPTDYERNVTGLERSDFVTANCFYRKMVLQEIGGFDERFTTAWREDSDLFFTLCERKYPLAWSRGAIVVHPVRPTTWGSSLREQKKSFFNALLYKKHPKLYWKYIQPSPPWNYYAAFTAFFVGVIGLLLSNSIVSIACLTIWVLLGLLFAVQRLQSTSHTASHVAEMIVTSLFIPFLSLYWRLRGSLYWRVLFL
jgi:glycosyltransferase involved in cell wall biosynthesis